MKNLDSDKTRSFLQNVSKAAKKKTDEDEKFEEKSESTPLFGKLRSMFSGPSAAEVTEEQLKKLKEKKGM